MERSDCFVSYIGVYEDNQGSLVAFIEWVTETSKVSTTLTASELGEYLAELQKAYRLVKVPTLTMQDIWGL